MHREIKTLSELSLDGKGTYGIAAPAVPYSNDLYTYLRITDINDNGNLNKDSLKSVDDKKAMILYLLELEQAQEEIIFMMNWMEHWYMQDF